MVTRSTPIVRTVGVSLTLGLLLVLGGCSVWGASPPQTAMQKAEPEAVPTGATAGPVEGLRVHGRWTIEVRDPDGTLAERREFENALVGPGDVLLTNILGRAASVGGWRVILDQGVPNICDDGSGNPFPCEIGESTDNPASYRTLNLTVLADVGATPPAVVLSGSVIAQFDGDIRTVWTWAYLCGSAVAPDNCPGGVIASSGNMTRTNLATPIVVLTGQQVQVNVVISFS